MSQSTKSARDLRKALGCIDWQQVVLNGGPPCFHIERGRFCLAAERWAGHGVFHNYVSLADLLESTYSEARIAANARAGMKI